MAKDIDGVVLLGKGGCQVLRAVIVDEGYSGGLSRYLCRGDDPAEGVVVLAKIARQLSVELLSGHVDVLIVEIDAQVDFVFLIFKVRTKDGAVALRLGGEE